MVSSFVFAYQNEYNVSKDCKCNCTTDKNVPGADGVLKCWRALAEFFNKSTQASTELKKSQVTLTIPITVIRFLWEYSKMSRHVGGLHGDS